jgi:two-component system, chemotaxis family, chemotaxis protein CheY
MHAGKRILVVDDSKTMTNIVSQILKDAKYPDIDCLYDGVSALAALRQKEYDLVITDWQMAPISGIELTKLIRTDTRLSAVRIILITGLHSKEDDAWLNGADGYLTKPFEPRDLVQKVEDVLFTSAWLVSWTTVVLGQKIFCKWIGTVHMRYQYIVLGCAALASFILIQSLIAFAFRTYKRRADGRRAVERLRNLPRGEPLEPPTVPLPAREELQPIRERPEPLEVQPSVSREVFLPISAAVEPIFERANQLEIKPAVAIEEPLPVGAKVQPILERADPLEIRQVVTTEEPLPGQPNLERGQPLEPRSAASPGLPLPVGSKVWAARNFGSVTEGTPGIITGVADARFFWESPMYLCTFANNTKVRARPKDIEPCNHGHSLEELEQPDLKSILSKRMTLRAQQLLYGQRA